MLLAAALVPQTALLVPGAAGRAEVLTAERRAVLEAVADLVATGPDRVVLVVPGAVRPVTGRLRPTLAAASIDDDRLGWPVPVLGVPSADPARGAAPALAVGPPVAPTVAGTAAPAAGPDEPAVVDDVAAAVGLHLLARAGWRGPVGVVGASADADPAGRGRALAAGPQRVALLLCASLSARRGPGAPLAEDDRAPAFDDAVLADLARLGGAG
ncbi:MAG TPA: hypothetical protein VN257_09850, partial [Actinotalea sp.]|nr:hypothetical protein [Actinotalea sp.]